MVHVASHIDTRRKHAVGIVLPDIGKQIGTGKHEEIVTTDVGRELGLERTLAIGLQGTPWHIGLGTKLAGGRLQPCLINAKCI